MSRITIEYIDTSRFNPFNAEPEELLAFLMDENALISENSKINGISAKKYCRNFYEKRKQFHKTLKGIS